MGVAEQADTLKIRVRKLFTTNSGPDSSVLKTEVMAIIMI